MRPTHGLRGLQVREPGHDDVHLALGAVDGDGDELAEVAAEEEELGAQPLRVSVATWSLRLRPVWSLPATEPMSSPSLRSFAVWMSSSPSFTSNASAAHSAATASGAGDELVALRVGDDARLGERRGAALAAADVLLRHAPVEGQGLVELLHQRVDVLAEATAPELLLLRHGDDARAARAGAARTRGGVRVGEGTARPLRAVGARARTETVEGVAMRGARDIAIDPAIGAMRRVRRGARDGRARRSERDRTEALKP